MKNKIIKSVFASAILLASLGTAAQTIKKGVTVTVNAGNSLYVTINGQD